MKTFLRRLPAHFAAVALLMLVISSAAFADPGPHGPGGEHLDTPGGHATSTPSQPRIETKSELFELVGYLGAGELSVMINRFETNEPVLDARVQVATGAAKAVARFHGDHGDYAIDDPAFLKLMSVPGEHALIFTIIAGSDRDLLEGALVVTPAQSRMQPSPHSHALDYALIAAAALTLVIAALAIWRRRARKRTRSTAAGELS